MTKDAKLWLFVHLATYAGSSGCVKGKSPPKFPVYPHRWFHLFCLLRRLCRGLQNSWAVRLISPAPAVSAWSWWTLIIPSMAPSHVNLNRGFQWEEVKTFGRCCKALKMYCYFFFRLCDGENVGFFLVLVTPKKSWLFAFTASCCWVQESVFTSAEGSDIRWYAETWRKKHFPLSCADSLCAHV